MTRDLTSDKVSVMNNYAVYKYVSGVRHGAVSGMGRNKGTWGYMHSKKTAQKWAKRCQETEESSYVEYKVESVD